MSVFKPRNRLVNFRLSEEEFDKLKALCPLHGARSISDFARSSVLERLEETPAQATAQAETPVRTVRLDDKVTELESRVAQLVNLIQGIGVTNPPASAGESEQASPVNSTQQIPRF
jgi:hypothetical protein